MKNIHKNTQNIYITSDEEIKEGWSYDRMMGTVNKTDNVYSNKIILTTDQDLIKDGVQAIDDEFLEWFVKNPSFEEVEFQNVPDYIYNTEHSCYKIIIPKEEPKQGWSKSTGDIAVDYAIGQSKAIQKCMQLDAEMAYKSIPKQETLEEFAERLCPNKQVEYDMILEGAKWQQEQQDKNKYSDEKEFYKYMAKQDSWKSTGLIIQEFIQLKLKEQDKKLYSEEEVYGMLQKLRLGFKVGVQKWQENFEFDLEEWFNKFKKK
jgi:hypothetical protein